MVTLKITTVGNSTGVILPKEVLQRLKVQKGDSIVLTESSEGGYMITPYDPNFKATMEAYERVRRDYKDALKALAE
ncbi:MAG: AbrB/MazE/SpoVT family DNA-binding domain-containing protein [Bryobacteraceae bacterium]